MSNRILESDGRRRPRARLAVTTAIVGLLATAVYAGVVTFLVSVEPLLQLQGVPTLVEGGPTPHMINHQGVIAVNGVKFSGSGMFAFALVNPIGGNCWTNDGSNITTMNRPDAHVTLPVANGIYNVRLGDTSLSNMVPIPHGVFVDDKLVLRIWFDDGQNGWNQLAPDHVLASVPYAFAAGNGAPVGSIMPYAGVASVPPPGWLLCDGTTVPRDSYPHLWDAIGTKWGHGDGSTTFHLPDLRGRFLRGVDHGQGRDTGPRFADAPGGETGDAVGSAQEYMTENHLHGAGSMFAGIIGSGGQVPYLTRGGGWTSNNRLHGIAASGWSEPHGTGVAVLGSSATAGASPTTDGGNGWYNETRPRNSNVEFIIKY